MHFRLARPPYSIDLVTSPWPTHKWKSLLMKAKYGYLVQEICMAGTPTYPVIQDEEAFPTLLDARRHLKRLLGPRESISPESYWRSSYQIQRMQFGNYYASHC
jgi:hypothetical protein